MLRRSLCRVAKQAFSTSLQHEAWLGNTAPTWAPHLPAVAMTNNVSRQSTLLPSLAALPWLPHIHQFGNTRSFSAAPEGGPLKTSPLPSPPASSEAHRLACVITPQSLPAQNVRIAATYVGSGINIYDLMARPEFKGHYQKLHKGTVILALSDAKIPEKAETTGMPIGPYLVATSYGSAVYFNVDSAAKEKWLEVLRSVATDPIVGDKKYNEGTIILFIYLCCNTLIKN